MIDIHSHIVFDVDDGARDIEESIEMVKEAKEAGFEKIIITPHYIESCYEIDRNEIEKRVSEIEDRLKEIKCYTPLYIGNEIYITEDIVELLNARKASSINDTRYVLFELPLNSEAMNLNRVIYRLLENGKVPILAHPERYPFVQKDVNVLIPLIQEGVIMQANYGSIIGRYGKHACKTIKKMLSLNMVHLLGSDCHRDQTIYLEIDDCLNKIRKIITRTKLEEITTINQQKILDNEKIDLPNAIYEKKSIFKKIFK